MKLIFCHFTFFLLLLWPLASIQAYYKYRHHVEKLTGYHLVDLGEVSLSKEQLSHYNENEERSLAPKINNRSEVIFNDVSGGFVWNKARGLQSDEAFTAFFYDINDIGTILLARQEGKREVWYLWCEKNGLRRELFKIDLPQLEGRLCLSFLDEMGKIAGTQSASPDESSVVAWPGDSKLYDIAQGRVRALSSGYLLASNLGEGAPFIWHYRGGLLVLPDHRCFKRPHDVQYVDMIFDYDNGVYGTFFYRSRPKELWGFYWEPQSEKFTVLDLGGMRLSALNAAGIMVGSLEGRAVLRTREGMLFDLTTFSQGEGPRWLLEEATDINDLGEIVGYGTVRGKRHIFLLEPRDYIAFKAIYQR